MLRGPCGALASDPVVFSPVRLRRPRSRRSVSDSASAAPVPLRVPLPSRIGEIHLTGRHGPALSGSDDFPKEFVRAIHRWPARHPKVKSGSRCTSSGGFPLPFGLSNEVRQDTTDFSGVNKKGEKFSNRPLEPCQMMDVRHGMLRVSSMSGDHGRVRIGGRASGGRGRHCVARSVLYCAETSFSASGLSSTCHDCGEEASALHRKRT